MPSTSINLGLALYNTAAPDENEKIIDWVSDECGTHSASNMNLIDAAMGDLQTDIDAIDNAQDIVPVAATLISGADYQATGISDITAYDTGLIISVRLSATPSGTTVTLNINSLGAKDLKKGSSAYPTATLEDVVDDLTLNREYIFRYDGTRWVWVGAVTANQIALPSNTDANLLVAGTSGEIEVGSYAESDFSGRVEKTTAPTISDNAYEEGTVWLDTTNDKTYILRDIDPTSGFGLWKEVGVAVYLNDINVFTADGTWTKPSNLHHAIIEVVGGGGGGGGAEGGTSQAASGSGGTGGTYALKWIYAGSLGATETVTVGVGGTGGTAGANDGTNGETSSFGSHVTSPGGRAGSGGAANNTPRTGATGGYTGNVIASGGNINLYGGHNVSGLLITNTSVKPSSGGKSFYGGEVRRSSNGDTAGVAGLDYGGGGSGGQQGNNASGFAGGDGADGIVVVYEYVYDAIDIS